MCHVCTDSTAEARLVKTHMSCSRQCQVAVCKHIEIILQPVANKLRDQLQSADHGCSSPTKLSQLLCNALCSSNKTSDSAQTVANYVAVAYALRTAAGTDTTPGLFKHAESVNQLIALLALLLSLDSISQHAPQVLQDWQFLLACVGLSPCHVCILLSPASKATFVRLEAAAKHPVSALRLQVGHSSMTCTPVRHASMSVAAWPDLT